LSYAYRRNLDWLVTDFTTRVPAVAHAVVVSADGVLLARSEDIPPAFAEQLALITPSSSGWAGDPPCPGGAARFPLDAEI